MDGLDEVQPLNCYQKIISCHPYFRHRHGRIGGTYRKIYGGQTKSLLNT